MHKLHPKEKLKADDAYVSPAYGGRAIREPVPKYEILAKEMPSEVVYWMEDHAKKLMAETFGVQPKPFEPPQWKKQGFVR